MSTLVALGLMVLSGLLLALARFGLSRERLTERLQRQPLFSRLYQGLALALEAGWGVGYHLGPHSLWGQRGGSLLLSLPVFRAIGQWVLKGDRPPEATTGDGWAYLLAREIGTPWQRPPRNGGPSSTPTVVQLTGLRPWEYAAGTVALADAPSTELALFFGSFGPEAGWMSDMANQRFGGTEDLLGQATLYATCDHSLVGDPWMATGAYTQAGRLHLASAWVYDVLRWLVWLALLVGAPLALFLGGGG